MSDASTAKGVVHSLLIGHPKMGGSWHGPSVKTLLEGITAEQAAAHPVSGVRSIWEYLLHILVWQDEVRKMAALRRYTPPEQVESWPDVTDTSDAAWLQTLDRFHASCDALVEVLQALTDEDLSRPVEGAPFPLKVAVHGVAHHSLYHAAQIAVLRKAIG
ncbi:MAG: DinB family protein [Candidatus Hydrogenedentes bacterium]|nr:DinB family protein [Candidatus Hydrogenedentota bacterium]